MRIEQILLENCVISETKAQDKAGVLEELAQCLVREHAGVPLDSLIASLLERENLGSTGIGDNIAIPHSRLPGITATMSVFGRSSKGIEFDSLDGKPVHLIFMLVAPENSSREHLMALARISRLFQKNAFRTRLREAPSTEAIYQLILEEDAKL